MDNVCWLLFYSCCSGFLVVFSLLLVCFCISGCGGCSVGSGSWVLLGWRWVGFFFFWVGVVLVICVFFDVRWFLLFWEYGELLYLGSCLLVGWIVCKLGLGWLGWLLGSWEVVLLNYCVELEDG